MGSYQSGQMGLTVTQMATPTVVRIHHCPQQNSNKSFIAKHFSAKIAQLIEH